MVDITTRELLSRIAIGKIKDIPEFLQEQQIVSKIFELRRSLSAVNVLGAARQLFPEYFVTEIDDSVEDLEIVEVYKQKLDKQNLIKLVADINEKLLFNKDNPNFDWSKLQEEVTAKISGRAAVSNHVINIGDLSFDEELCVARTGYDLLDHYMGGGIEPNSYTVFYSASSIGKTTLVTAQIAARLLEQGKKPLIINLEGSPKRLITRILSYFAGCFNKDIKDYTEDDKSKLLELSKLYADIPIVTANARGYFQLKALINKYSPDVLIYDQLTISGNGREFQEIAKISEVLKRISLQDNLPVIALTQSSGKNYSFKAEEATEGEGETIKYAQAIFEDATTAIQIARPRSENTSQRLFIIRKSKVDSTSAILPVSILVEMTEKGVICLGLKDGFQPLIEKSTVLAGKSTNKTDQAPKITKKVEIIKEEAIVLQKNIIELPEQFVDLPEEYPQQLYSQDTFVATPKRLLSAFGNDTEFQTLATLIDTSMHYENDGDPSWFLQFENSNSLNPIWGNTYFNRYSQG